MKIIYYDNNGEKHMLGKDLIFKTIKRNVLLDICFAIVTSFTFPKYQTFMISITKVIYTL